MGFDPRYMVKQYLTRLVKADGREFDVFNTGEPGWLLFVPVQNGIQSTIHVPVRRRDLKREVARLIPRP